MSETEIKRLLRKARNIDPEAFDRAISDYRDRGDQALAPCKPPGAPERMDATIRALFLADVMNRSEKLGSQNKAAKDIADNRTAWRSKTGRGKYMNANTVKSHIRNAKDQYESDPDFRDKVDFYREALGFLEASD